MNWSAGELADKGNVPSNAFKDGVAFTETETVTDTFRATWEINDSLELRYIFGHRTVEVDTSSDLDGMDNSAIGGIQGELQLQTIGGALLGGVVPPAIPIPGLGLLPLDPSYNFQLALDMVDTINDFGRAPIFDTVSNADYKQTSHEFQLVGSTGTVDWATGVFFFDDSSEWRNIASPTFPLAASYSRSADHDTKATSVFGEATWRPSGTNWAFTAGLRYTDEEKEITYLWRDAAPGSAGIAGYIGVAIQETISALMGNPVDIPFDLGAGYYWDLADLEKIPEPRGCMVKASATISAMFRVVWSPSTTSRMTLTSTPASPPATAPVGSTTATSTAKPAHLMTSLKKTWKAGKSVSSRCCWMVACA